METPRPSTDSHRAVDASRATRNLAAWVVLGSGLIAFLLSSLAIWLVRERLHIGCSMGQPGSEGAETWFCGDGIGYLGVAVTLGGMWFLVILLGALIAKFVRHGRAACTLLVLIAAVSTAWVLSWTWYGSSELVQDEYAPMAGTEYWALTVGPAAIACFLGMAAGLVSLFLPGRFSRILCFGGALGVAIATLLQPGLSVNTIPAVGLLAAGAVRAAPVRGHGS